MSDEQLVSLIFFIFLFVIAVFIFSIWMDYLKHKALVDSHNKKGKLPRMEDEDGF